MPLEFDQPTTSRSRLTFDQPESETPQPPSRIQPEREPPLGGAQYTPRGMFGLPPSVTGGFERGVVGGTAGLIGGAMELFPGAVGRAGAEVSRFGQRETGKAMSEAPVTGTAGAFLPYALPVGRALQATSLGGRVASGAATGGALGYLGPTGEQDEAKREQAKRGGAGLGALLGGGLPLGISGVAAAGRNLYDFGRRAVNLTRGGEAAPARSTVRSTVTEEARGAQRAASEAEQRLTGELTALERGGAEGQAAAQAAQGNLAALENQLSAGGGMTEERFVKAIRDTATALYDRLYKAREQGANFAAALRQAGDELIVPTGRVSERIEDALSRTENPVLERMLRDIQSRVVTRIEGAEQPLSRMSLPRAESLRKVLDTYIKAGMDAEGRKLNREVVAELRNIRKELVGQASASSTAYRTALERFNVLSRPLDIFSRGELGKIVQKAEQTDRGYVAREAEVVGLMLRRGGESARYLERLAQENPEIRNATRLYFARRLFGEGKSPSNTDMRNFLIQNESVLRRLNLYDEFANARQALETARRALNEATGQIPTGAEITRRRSAVEEARAAGREARQAEINIQMARPEQTARVAETYINQLYSQGRIDAARYEQMLGEVRRLQQATKSDEELKRNLLKILGLVGAGGAAGYFGLGSSVFGGR